MICKATAHNVYSAGARAGWSLVTLQASLIPPLLLPCSIPLVLTPSEGHPSGSPHPLASGWAWQMGGISGRKEGDGE